MHVSNKMIVIAGQQPNPHPLPPSNLTSPHAAVRVCVRACVRVHTVSCSGELKEARESWEEHEETNPIMKILSYRSVLQYIAHGCMIVNFQLLRLHRFVSKKVQKTGTIKFTFYGEQFNLTIIRKTSRYCPSYSGSRILVQSMVNQPSNTTTTT